MGGEGAGDESEGVEGGERFVLCSLVLFFVRNSARYSVGISAKTLSAALLRQKRARVWQCYRPLSLGRLKIAGCNKKLTRRSESRRQVCVVHENRVNNRLIDIYGRVSVRL